MLDRTERLDFDVLRHRVSLPPWELAGAVGPRACARDPPRHPARGRARALIADTAADVLICGASFAGLAVARELAGSGADVLLVDRYEIGERATSACAAPLPWLEALGLGAAVRQELPCMAFHTPHGSVRYRLPWSWAAFDYRELCRLLFEQCDARFEIANVAGRRGELVVTDRGELQRAAGGRRARAGAACSPGRATSRPEAPAVARPRGAPRRRRRATWTSGSSARSCATATAGACPRVASSAWAWARTSRATT